MTGVFFFYYLVWVLERPTINTVVGSVQATFREPSDIPILESPRSDSMERTVPVECLSRNL